MTFGPFLFMAPMALIGLIALPIIWYVLRATPPAPQQVSLPSLRLLDTIEPEEETPARTPWWLLLLRLAAAALAILGLSLPLYAPGAKPGAASSGPVLVVIDDGWTSADRWGEVRSAAISALDAEDRDTAAHLLLTAPRTLNADPSERLDRSAFEARIRSLSPQAWAVDRDEALTRLEASELRPGRILWITDGLDPQSASDFGAALSELAPLSIFAAPPRGPVGLTGLTADAQGAALTARRAETKQASSHYVSAMTLDGAALATAKLEFDAGAKEATASFSLPPAALSRIARFQITGGASAGSVWLWDSADRTRRVGLVSGDTTAQPLLSDIHYVRKALEPFATITEGNLVQLIEDNPDAIIMTDIGQIGEEDLGQLTEWIEAGGALIRFAGPRMAAQGDELVPAPLRRASRAIGGALTWEEPQRLGAFPETSPFAGLLIPEEARVRQQVLARPGPELATRTWARLADGSPLVTAAPRGQGSLILFHITAGPDWSDLPYSKLFVDMLRRSIAAGKGETVPDEDGLYTPRLVLNGLGRLDQPGASATPLKTSEFGSVLPSETHPPGLYQGPSGTRALNVAANYTPLLITNWPAGSVLLGDAETTSIRLGGWLLGLALLILAADMVIALSLLGKLPGLKRTAIAAGIVALMAPGFIPHAAEAQIRYSSDLPEGLSKEAEAALALRFAYIQTGDARTDRVTRAGLDGLSETLFRRSSVEPSEPHAINPETDSLDVYPLIFFVLPDSPKPLSSKAIDRLNTYMRNGGALFIDTRKGGEIGGGGFEGLETILAGLDTPTLATVPRNHVLTRSFYLLDDLPGRYAGRSLWIEATGGANKAERRGDGVSRLFIGDADFMSAWAIDERGRALYSVDGGDPQREQSRRFGVNLVMYVLTGNYKEDQVHIPALLERLGEDEGVGDFESDPNEGVIP